MQIKNIVNNAAIIFFGSSFILGKSIVILMTMGKVKSIVLGISAVVTNKGEDTFYTCTKLKLIHIDRLITF